MTGAFVPVASTSASMKESYPPPFSMRRPALDTASWSFAVASYSCGSWLVEEMIAVTSTVSPAIALTMSP